MVRLIIWMGAIASLAAAAPVIAQQQQPPPPQPRAQPHTPPSAAAKGKTGSAAPGGVAADSGQRLSGVIGVAIDSIHGGPLRSATVSVVGTSRQGLSDSAGQFRIDSVPPGEYKLALFHPLLDSIGLAVATQTIAMPAGRYAVVRLGTPSQPTVLDLFCPRDKRLTGPGALIGRVLDADTDEPAMGARVVLYWTELEVGRAVGVHRVPRVRETTVDSNGTYRICGTPQAVQGSLRASRGTVATADVPINVQGEVLTMATLHLAALDTGVTASAPPAPGSPTKAQPTLRRGNAVVSGQVTDAVGRALEGAEISVQGAASTTVTNDSGLYTLRGLPSGTQAMVVRKVAFTPARVAVDLTSRAVRRANVKLMPAPPTLATVQVEGKREKGLREVGFTQRQKSGLGHYLTEDQIAKKMATQMTDIFTTMPGLQIDYTSGDPTIRSSRNAGGGCVNYVVDGVPVQLPGPGDFNNYMRPEEVSAVEVYAAAEAPAQYQHAGSSDCSVIMIWTKTRVGG